MGKICVVYRQTDAGLGALIMAAQLGKHLYTRQAIVPITVFAAGNEQAAAALQTSVGADEMVKSNVAGVVAQHTKVPFDVELFNEASGPAIEDDSVFVSDVLLPGMRFHHCVYPGAECGLTTRHTGPVVIPFSNKDSGLRAAAVVFEWIKQSRMSTAKGASLCGGGSDVIFYHTTWKDPNVLSADPVDHMCENAQRVRIALEDAAEQHGIRFRTIVETHDDIVKGILETSFAEHAVLVATARGADVTQGSNVDQLVEQSAIPVLVVSAHTQPIAAPADEDHLADYRAAREAERAVKPVVKGGLLSKLLQAELLYTPNFVMSVSASMYALKVLTKCFAGWWFFLATMLADGFHNVADLAQSFVVMFVIRISQRPANERFPYGRKNLEWISSGVIGIGLGLTGAYFFVLCFTGLAYFWWPAAYELGHAWIWLPIIEISILNAHTFPWVVGIMAGSALLSVVVGKYQVLVGTRTGHASMIADGQETRSDALVELVVLAGIIFDFALGVHSIHYIFGLIVAGKICMTAFELIQTGYRVICQHSIEDEHRTALLEAALNTSGVQEVQSLTAFLVGHTVMVHATVVSSANGAAASYIKQAIEKAFDAYLTDPETEFQGSDLHIIVRKPDPKFARIGYALAAVQGKMYVAPSLDQATHLAVCDIQRDSVVKTHVVAINLDLVGLILEKRFAVLYAFSPDDNVTAKLQQELGIRIKALASPEVIKQPFFAPATTYALSPLGVVI